MGRTITPTLDSIAMGTALQLQEADLWPAWAYAALACAACVPLSPVLLKSAGARALLCATLIAFSLTGLRAIAFDSHALAPTLEGRDIEVTGVVAAMPQRNETGLRFRLEVEEPSILPPQILLGWYGAAAADDAGAMDLSRAVPELHAGERWRFTVRLKAPHGNVNPHGFDYELWLWEQGLQATGYVRSGARDPTPRRVAQTWLHPVELARQSVRDAAYRAVDDRRTAGVIAALVAGDQNAIERADWDVFLATGDAHLMSNSGLHITKFA